MKPLEAESPKEKPAKMGFDHFYLVHFCCGCCGAYVVVKNTEHFNLVCSDCDPDRSLGTKEN
jgi:hypothetical protein